MTQANLGSPTATQPSDTTAMPFAVRPAPTISVLPTSYQQHEALRSGWRDADYRSVAVNAASAEIAADEAKSDWSLVAGLIGLVSGIGAVLAKLLDGGWPVLLLAGVGVLCAALVIYRLRTVMRTQQWHREAKAWLVARTASEPHPQP
ncbi:hypothetical protein [Nocardioides sp. KR10-350]|uniref:hypothetical protein n=1 Tax=Nocardioides cheoyonin TaxID=3156615 RepID=UPI0032B45D97